MNKKVSTIFAMAALMGGAYCGSAYAKTLPVNVLTAKDGKVTLPKEVVLMQGDLILGFEKDANGTTQVIVEDYKNMESLEKALNFKWIVTTVAQEQGEGAENRYVFQNVVTKDTLSFQVNDFSKLQLTNKDKNQYAKDGYYTFTFGEPTGANYPAYSEDGSILYSEKAKVDDENVALTLTNGETDAATLTKVTTDPETSITTPEIFKLGELRLNAVSAEELNALFNERGFNFAAKPAVANVEVEGNIFAEQTVWAFEVKEKTVEAEDQDWNDGKFIGYKLTNEAQHDKDLVIPAGTYFFTNVKFNGSTTFGSDNIKASDINWLESTLIYLSASESEEGTDSDRANGGGFVLATQNGSEFKYKENASVQQGNDTWITNACFTPRTNFAANANYPYSLTVNEFWYQEKKGAAGTDKQKKATVCLDVVSYDGGTRQSLVSKTFDGDPAAVFMLKASSVVDGKTLLHDTKKAAVYTIKFVSGNSYLNSKYLTVGKGDNGFQWEAKGAAIYDETFPIFQYTITAVSDNNEVTFTNRETGQNFTAQLFAVEGNENRYYMSIKDINGGASETNVITNTNFKVQPYTVENKTNTYAVEKTKNSEGAFVGAQPFAADYVVELKSIEDVDSYAGFLKETETVSRALAFARDVNDTSNKMYAIVDNDEYNNKYLVEDDFTNDIYASAQWQLKKYGEVAISRVYVYNNTTTKSVDNVPEGDKVKAYTYTLQYIEDGEFYQDNDNYKFLGLQDNDGDGIAKPILDNAKLQKEADKFIIKENVDGSVSLIKYDNSDIFTGLQVANYNEYKGVEVKNIATDKKPDYCFDLTDEVYKTESEARAIKTYLEVQPVDISWPAHEGHVTIESELGNYINMNENRDAIVVDETDADTYYLYVTDTEKKNVVPSFYITKGIAAENGERMFMFNPKDSVDYYVAEGTYDKKYQWAEDATKVIFKAAKINDSRDTLTINVKGEDKYIAKKGDDDNKNIWGGLNRFKWQIIEATDAEGYYRIRQTGSENVGNYLSALNDKMTWSGKDKAMLFTIESVAAPTANEGVSATEVKIIATDGAVNVKNAAGKNVVISTILGQIVANEVLTSDNATISVPAGIAIVSVDGEEAVKVSVR